jgi:hypothetical protein
MASSFFVMKQLQVVAGYAVAANAIFSLSGLT